MDTLDIPEYAVNTHSGRNPGITYGDFNHVKSRLNYVFRYLSDYRSPQMSVYKRKGEKYVLVFSGKTIESFVGTNDEIKKRAYRIIENA